jgi:hypothetical protein
MADSLISGLLSLTPSAVEQGSALNASNYTSVLHNLLPVNKVDDSPVQDMFLGLIVFPIRTQKTTMLLRLSALMDIFPDAINGFKYHQLEEASTLPALTNNKVEEGFLGSVVLAIKYF